MQDDREGVLDQVNLFRKYRQRKKKLINLKKVNANVIEDFQFIDRFQILLIIRSNSHKCFVNTFSTSTTYIMIFMLFFFSSVLLGSNVNTHIQVVFYTFLTYDDVFRVSK